jgi:anti-anti-sigma factor
MTVAEISQVNGRVPVTILRLRERIHLDNFAELENLVKDAYEAGTRNLVIDLEQSNTLTSIGLRALVVIHKIMVKNDTSSRLRVTGATTMIHEIMEVTGIAQFIDIYDTVDEAIASF